MSLVFVWAKGGRGSATFCFYIMHKFSPSSSLPKEKTTAFITLLSSSKNIRANPPINIFCPQGFATPSKCSFQPTTPLRKWADSTIFQAVAASFRSSPRLLVCPLRYRQNSSFKSHSKRWSVTRYRTPVFHWQWELCYTEHGQRRKIGMILYLYSRTLRAPVFSTFTKTDFYAIIKKSKLWWSKFYEVHKQR